MNDAQPAVVNSSAQMKYLDLLHDRWGQGFGESLTDRSGGLIVSRITQTAGEDHQALRFEYIEVLAKKADAAHPTGIDGTTVNYDVGFLDVVDIEGFAFDNAALQ
ncbi:hypothetical protein QT22_00265, partial [Staphylococcus aureus]